MEKLVEKTSLLVIETRGKVLASVCVYWPEQHVEKGMRMKYIFITLIKFYRKAISPFKPRTCRFYPSCSEYSLVAFRRFGALRGVFLTIKRISKCHPFHSGGVDLVPEKEQKHKR